MNGTANMIFEKGLPANTDAERFVLGSIQLNDELYPDVAGVLVPEDFSLEKHRRIFARMKDLYDRGEKIDRVTLSNELQKQGQIESVGGFSYLVSLDEGMPAFANIDSYIRIVKDKATLRQLIVACQRISDQCFAAGDLSSDILESATGILERVRERNDSGDTQWLSPYEILQRAGPELLCPERGVMGLKTPWPKLTELTSGWSPGDLVIVGGRTSMGKSVIGLQQAYATALEGKGVAYISLEMSKESLVRRLVAGISRVDSHHARSGFLGHEDRRRMLEAGADLEGLPIYIDDSQSHTPAAVSASLRRLRARGDVSLVIIDHLQLMKTTGRAESRHQELAEIAHSFKRLAGKMNCVVMLLSQLNRACEQEKRRPNLSDLKESGAIEEDADVVLFVHRPEMFNRADPSLRGQAELIIAKQRNGPTGRKIPLTFQDRYQIFEETGREAEEYA
jgi:replicative DNA helicase